MSKEMENTEPDFTAVFFGRTVRFATSVAMPYEHAVFLYSTAMDIAYSHRWSDAAREFSRYCEIRAGYYDIEYERGSCIVELRRKKD